MQAEGAIRGQVWPTWNCKSNLQIKKDGWIDTKKPTTQQKTGNRMHNFYTEGKEKI